MSHLTTIPFAGFYYSLHDSELDQGLDQMFSDHASGCNINTELRDHAFNLVNWRYVHEAYAKEYCKNFAEHFEIPLTFDELKSPREYNFTTDRIFALVGELHLIKLFVETDKDLLRAKIKERFTSRSGFSSFYSPRLEEWPARVTDWDHNQIGTLFEVLVGEDFDQYAEYDLMSDSFSNGFIDNLLCDSSKEVVRLVNIHDYLEKRAEREHATT